MKVRVLPDQLINQISAGEVVDRPSSVVRELVDNAVDSGATEISVTLEDGGHSLIRVVDNGCGMGRDDALLAFERHATSKLSSLDDLQSITTMGFRGEALPSIAAVSKVRMRTKLHDSDLGTEIVLNGGKIDSVKSVPAGSGTAIEVARIFFNTPARRKFLKQPKSELQRIKTWLKFSSIANPGIHYRLIADGEELLNLPRRENSLERAKSFFKGSMLAFEKKRGPMIAAGFVGHPSLAQADSSALVILVNGRLVSDRMLLRAVKEGFDSTLKEREYPVGFLSITLPPESIDVNVHPQKSEIRFATPQPVFALVREAVLAVIYEFKAPIAMPERQVFRSSVNSSGSAAEALSFELVARSAETALAADTTQVPATSYWEVPTAPFPRTRFPEPLPYQAAPQAGNFRYSALRYIGQALECYLLCELDGALYVVDMHAAHERCNYNLIRGQLKQKSIPTQRLLVPIEVQVLGDGAARLAEQAEFFASFGLEYEMKDDHTVVVGGIPAILPQKQVPVLVKELAAIPPEQLSDGKMKESIDHVAARLACHASIRSGYEIKREEAYALFEQLDTAGLSSACPHGRPVIVSFSEAAIEGWFGRDN